MALMSQTFRLALVIARLNLPNFPDEHLLSAEYEHVILRDIAAAWREFSLNANSLLLAKASPAAIR